MSEPCIISAEAFTLQNIGCGVLEGMAVVSVTGASGIHVLSLDNGANIQFTDTFSNLSAGNYTVLIQDTAGCEITTNFTIVDIPEIIVSSTTTNAACGAASGSITITASGGTNGYTFSLDGINFQANNMFSSLGVGSYTTYVKDNSECIGTGNAVIMDNGNVGFTTITTDAGCGLSDGTITITATGGTSPFEYSFDNGANFQTSSIFSTASAIAYDVVVRDNSGCSAAAQVMVNQAATTLTFTTSITDASCGASDGEIVVNGSGGAGGYSYSINGGSYVSNNTFSVLAVGAYTISIQDANGCIVSQTSIMVSQAATSLTFTTSVADASCGASDGQIVVNGSGGAGGYMYSINGGTYVSSATFSSLSSSSYIVSIQDVNGCVYTQSNIVVDNLDVSFNSVIAPIINNTCASTICHGAMGSAAKPLLRNYAEISSKAAQIKAELLAGTMPKTGTISAADKAAILCWIDAGAPNN